MFCLVRYNASDLKHGTRDVWGITEQWVEPIWFERGATKPKSFETMSEAAHVGRTLARSAGCTIHVEKIA